MKNIFIVFEGIDGSGTSTQARLLHAYYENSGQKAILTEEPSRGPIGNLIRQGMKKRVLFSNEKKLFDQQMAYLFAADRHDHLYNDIDGINKLLGNNNVISTRYYFSSLAYHCESEDDFNFVTCLNEKFPKPDIVIYIDNPVDVSLNRIQNRSSLDMYENKLKLEKVKENYEKIFKTYDDHKLIVDGTQDIIEIHKQIVKVIETKLDRC